jgi:hypothetical protein
MRKRLITPSSQAGTLHDEGWLDLDREAVVEVTSEEKEYPVEGALVAGDMRGWRAAVSGAQTIRPISFDRRNWGDHGAGTAQELHLHPSAVEADSSALLSHEW